LSARRSEAEKKSAGLDRLAPAELGETRRTGRRRLAVHPKPKERPRLKDDDVIGAARKPEIHGSVSLTYGWGGAGHFCQLAFGSIISIRPAAWVWASVLPPSPGDGFYGYYPDYYGSRYGVAAPVYFDASYRGGLRDDYAYGTGESAPRSGRLEFIRPRPPRTLSQGRVRPVSAASPIRRGNLPTKPADSAHAGLGRRRIGF